ncbi:MAG: GntR family transcriptional regulator, partial [Jhaorihella sp.]
MEAVCARLACERMTDEELEELKRVHEASRSNIGNGEKPGWAESNRAFHMILYDGCRNSFLKSQLVSLRPRTAGYLTQAYRSIGRAQESFKQHEELLQALIARDADAAVRMMSQHISLAAGAKGLSELLIRMPESMLA